MQAILESLISQYEQKLEEANLQLFSATDEATRQFLAGKVSAFKDAIEIIYQLKL